MREITDEFFAEFLRTRLTRRCKKALGVKIPVLGKDRGKVFIPKDSYCDLVMLFVSTREICLFDPGAKFDIQT